MTTQDFTMTLVVDHSPEEVFNIINNVKGWWSEGIEESTDKPGDEFNYYHKDMHYSRHKLAELVPGKKIVWLVTDSSLTFIEDKSEWTGTKISFDIFTEQSKTKIRFTHWGLVPEKECFEACSGGWTHYLQKSLLPLINTGKGLPDKNWQLNRQ